MSKPYETEPTSDAIDALAGPAIIEFGTNWCGFCSAAQPVIEAALTEHAQIPHIKVEDGKGRPLGRKYGVKLWPTLVFLRDGDEVARVVRPRSTAQVRDAIAALASS